MSCVKMGVVCLIKVLVFIGFLISGEKLVANALSYDYYYESCPYVERIVSNIVDEELQKEPSLSAGLLRLHFHDCFLEGCDASVLVDSTNNNKAEKDSPANQSLRGFEIIDKIKEEIEKECGGTVSCADIVALAARDAVSWAGGPYYYISLGRKDGRRSNIEDTRRLPSPTLNSTGLINLFSKYGFTVQDMVALSGGHTLGLARCASFKNRLKNFNSDYDVDPSLDSYTASSLSRTCDQGDNAKAPFDWTDKTFDNVYYKSLETGGGVLTSDQALFLGDETRHYVDSYAADQHLFFGDFGDAMVKMGLIDVKEGEMGEVRHNCRRINY